MLIGFIICVVAIAIWLAYEIQRAPLINDEGEIIDDPTTDFWDDENDMHHTDAKF